MASSIDSNTNEKLCENCQRFIAVQNYQIHEAICTLKFQLCESCNEPIEKSEFKRHLDENHSYVKCFLCFMELEKRFLNEHVNSECQSRPKHCQFCDLFINFNEFDEHELACGNRTELCDRCRKYIRLVDQFRHDSSNCRLESSVSQQLSHNSAPCIPPSLPTIPFTRARDLVKNLQDDIVIFENLNGNQEIQLPCEFCAKTFALDKLERHQVQCSREYGDFEDFKLPCEFCNQEISHLEIDQHQANCQSISSIDVQLASNMLPCEFCRQLFDFSIISDHQELCAKDHSKIPCEKCFGLIDCLDYSAHVASCGREIDVSVDRNGWDQEISCLDQSVDSREDFRRSE